ncbi:unnamed protein product, partial [Prorocentrum cordatum]
MWGELATVAAGLTQTYLASCPWCPEHRCPDCHCGRRPSIPACPACPGAPAVRQDAAEVELQLGLPWSWAVALLGVGCLAGACGAEAIGGLPQLAGTPEAASCAWVHVLYNGEGKLWHQRRRKYDLEEAHISAVRYAEARWPPPPGLARGSVYKFRAAPTQQELDDAFDQSEALERAEHRAREAAAGRDPAVIPPGGYLERLPVQPAAAAAGAGPPDAAAATRGQYRRGDEVLLPAAAVTLGDVALTPTGDGGSLCLRRLRRQDVMSWVGAEAAGDARILNDPVARRASKSSVTDFADWPVVGPRTTEWCVMFLNRRGGGPMDHHRYFTVLRGLETGDWGEDTHRMCLKAVEEAGTYDHLELCNLASFEVLFRQAQLVEYAHEQERVARQMAGGKGKKGAGKGAGLLDESLVFTGQHREAGGVMLAPEQMDFASREIERDANIMKQVRKAREERRALTNNKKKDG